jgi:glucosamine--fructose-6-phosphate aminotransferase (isomerizing)
MCGIVAYVGNQSCKDNLLKGLQRLEYRGYDSAGLGLLGSNGLQVHRAVGRVANLTAMVPESDATVGLAHTRWATHGGVEQRNAHPHCDDQQQVAIVHNGIIDNADALREGLALRGIRCTSDTDTEVIAHLIAEAYVNDPMAAVESTLARLRGTWGLVVAFAAHPGKLFVARHGSPLVLGFGAEGGVFVASDALAISPWVAEIVYLDDGDCLAIEQGAHAMLNHRAVTLTGMEEAELGDHACFMDKEILEQPDVLRRALAGRVTVDGAVLACITDNPALRRVSSVVLLACGTSFHAASAAARTLEAVAGIPARACLASEFVTDGPLLDPNGLYVAVSQSGETYDTLEALRRVKRANIPTLAVVNVVGSSLAREAGAGLFLHAGPEIAVASTKAFTAQLATLSALALTLAPSPTDPAMRPLREAMVALPDAVERTLDVRLAEGLDQAAQWIDDRNYVLFLGRGASRHVAEEASLKLKELAYVPCDAYGAGEMKHGPIAMLSDGTPVVVVVPNDVHREATLASIAEVRARGARVIAICEAGDLHVASKVDLVLPVAATHPLLTPILSVVPLQMLAARVAVRRGLDVDKPRNLAKSVTVG